MSASKEYPKFKVNTFINLDLDQLASDIMEIVDIAQVITLLDLRPFCPLDWSNTMNALTYSSTF